MTTNSISFNPADILAESFGGALDPDAPIHKKIFDTTTCIFAALGSLALLGTIGALLDFTIEAGVDYLASALFEEVFVLSAKAVMSLTAMKVLLVVAAGAFTFFIISAAIREAIKHT